MRWEVKKYYYNMMFNVGSSFMYPEVPNYNVVFILHPFGFLRCMATCVRRS